MNLTIDSSLLGIEEFARWLRRLRDLSVKAFIQARIVSVICGNPGDVRLMETKTAPYDVAEFLETPDEMAAYLEACLQESDGDAAFVAKALGDIARAKGMTQVAREAGLSRESLYKSLSGDRSPSFETILKVISALGLQLSAFVKEGAIVEDTAP